MIVGMCGIGVVKGFMDDQQANDNLPGWYMNETIQDFTKRGKMEELLDKTFPKVTAPNAHKGGAGFVSSGFINDAKCREAYAELSKTYRLVFQTPVRMNTNSKNLFFFAMWDTTGNNDVTPINGKWPF
jgi:hypothetical protein